MATNRSSSKKETPKSTAQQLGSIVKSCRDIMRKDKGLNGDIDRLPMLTWIMFLKFLDDMEQVREAEAKLAGKRYRPSIESPYRWRDWAAKPEGITGPELIAFINQDEAVRPDGKRGAGLFAYLRSLESTNGDRRDVIARVFQGTINRMVNGYLLRDVINKVNDIHFTSKDEIHTLGHMYETMLREMRDAAGDSGEFYTPRAVVKFIVTAVDPRLGETVLDPAAGTGGFLVEAFEHLRSAGETRAGLRPPAARHPAWHRSKAAPLPALRDESASPRHGVPGHRLRQRPAFSAARNRRQGSRGRHHDEPAVRRRGGEGDSVEFPGGQTDRRNRAALSAAHHAQTPPPGRRQAGRAVRHGRSQRRAIRRRHMRPHQGRTAQGLQSSHHRAASQRRLCPIHAASRQICFSLTAPGPRKDVWYYEQPLPRGQEELHEDRPRSSLRNSGTAWRGGRSAKRMIAPGKSATKDLLATGCNLDRKNPSAKEDIAHLPPQQLADSIVLKQQRIAEIMGEIKTLLGNGRA